MFGESHDGDTIYYRKRGGGIVAWNRRTGDSRQIADWTGGITGIVPSPAGSTVALVNPNRLVLVNLKTGEAQVRWETSDAPGARGRWLIRGGAWTANEQTFLLLARTDATNSATDHELWSLPVRGGEPRRSALDSEFRSLSMTPDGRRVAMLRSETVMQIWTLENFLPSR
jgi:hypothetical protein